MGYFVFFGWYGCSFQFPYYYHTVREGERGGLFAVANYKQGAMGAVRQAKRRNGLLFPFKHSPQLLRKGSRSDDDAVSFNAYLLVIQVVTGKVQGDTFGS